MSGRRGISLIELLFTLSACSVILTLSAGLIHRVMHAQSKARAIIDCERTAWRLSNQFRSDVHAAREAETENLAGDGVFLRLVLPEDQVVEYCHRDQTIVRTLLGGGSPKAREQYILSPEFNATIRQDGSRIVTLSITSQPPETPIAVDALQSIAHFVPVSFHVEARLNRDTWLKGSGVFGGEGLEEMER